MDNEHQLRVSSQPRSLDISPVLRAQGERLAVIHEH
jgi:hypothetical protein